jgi:Flp pilus assembly pilin Flp
MKDMAPKLYVRGVCAKERAKDRMVAALKDKSGATVVEYVVMAAIAVVVGLGVIRAFWGSYEEERGIGGVLNRIVTSMNTYSDAEAGSGGD